MTTPSELRRLRDALEDSRRRRETGETLPQDEVGYCYYGRYFNGDIKIGSTIGAPGRRAFDQGIELLAWETGGRRRERERHLQFAKHRVPGAARERFKAARELRALIAELRASSVGVAA